MTISLRDHAYTEVRMNPTWGLDMKEPNHDVIVKCKLPEEVTLLTPFNYSEKMEVSTRFCIVFYKDDGSKDFSFLEGNIEKESGDIKFFVPSENDCLDKNELNSTLMKPTQQGTQVYVW